MDFFKTVTDLFAKKDAKSSFLARQLLFTKSPLSRLVELYLYTNEGTPQSLAKFPMKKQIYDNMPTKLLLKCSRKVLKSTLISNVITLNMVRYNHYKLLYVAPQELSTKGFSGQYLSARFQSIPLRKIIKKLGRNDVYEKVLNETESSVILRYASEDATRIRGPAVDQTLFDEVQDMSLDIIPIILETMTMSKFKREIYAGTPLTRDNTINTLWNASSRLEWFTKCGCGKWNALIEENDPMKMIQEKGYSCSKCDRLLNTEEGQWVAYHPQFKELVGYHLAQPMLPHFNQDPKEWKTIYNKVTNGLYDTRQIFNEVFGLAYDVGSKPITEEDLMSKSVLGPMFTTKEGKGLPNFEIFVKNRHKYRAITIGVDWGVNMITSRTAVCMGAMRDDMVYEVFYARIMSSTSYIGHINEIAEYANALQAFCASDSGPDPIRGSMLMDATSTSRSQMIRYDHGKLIQHTDIPTGAYLPNQMRWVLHRSDTMSLVFRKIKEGRILFSKWDDWCECARDILNVNIEIKRGDFREEILYRHNPDKPDDFIHALNFAYCQALMLVGDASLQGPSSNSADFPIVTG